MSGAWIQTHAGRRFDLSNPDPASIDPVSLAVSLSRLCRFAGHCREFYSVAQHSVIVGDLVECPELKLPALLHDAHEALWGFCDPQRPVKELMPPAVVEFIEAHRRRVDEAIAERFGFDVELFYDPRIKLADRIALATERRDVMGYCPDEWSDMVGPSPGIIRPQSPDPSKRLFCQRLRRLLMTHRPYRQAVFC